MATEPGVTPEVSTDAETQNQAAEQLGNKEVAALEATDDAGEANSTEISEADLEKRRLERELRKAQRVNSKLYQELGSLKERVNQTPAPVREEGTQDPLAIARQISAVERFTEKSNEIVELGSKKYGSDYVKVVRDELTKEVGPLVVDNLPSPFMSAVMKVAKSQTHELLYEIGKNADIASELAELDDPIDLAIRLKEVQKELLDQSLKPKTSNAPTPLTPVKGKAKSNELSDDLPMDEWVKRREADLKAKRLRL
jgi:vacuolar-type H+-ATPase subunit H